MHKYREFGDLNELDDFSYKFMHGVRSTMETLRKE